MAEKLQVNPLGGWLRVGLAPYTSNKEIELFKTALLAFIEQHYS